jgi:hypothetical protein
MFRSDVLQKPDDPSRAEKKLFKYKDGGYALIQSIKPQCLAQELNDTPAGLLAWLVEKYRSLSRSSLRTFCREWGSRNCSPRISGPVPAGLRELRDLDF